MMMIDFHSHILPGIDDGAKDISESIRILDLMEQDDVDIIVATPHFYPHNKSVESFVSSRSEAFEHLKKNVKPSHPKILLGAEVLYTSKLLDEPNIDALKIQGTDFLLLELPYIHFTQSIYDGVNAIAGMKNVKIILAHVERYLAFNTYQEVFELFDEANVIGQMNCQSLIGMKSRKRCLELIKNGCVSILGTDYHRIERNDALLGDGLHILDKKLKKYELENIYKASEMVLANSETDDILNIMTQ